jgi:2-polyprenyl-3-methyl-5-hydroxy-6-metoxy-1,4-benzoquinol methylase
MPKILSALREKYPWNRIVDFLDEIIIEPVRYGKGKHYNAKKYWHNRFVKFGSTLKASGDRRMSEGENRIFYEKSAEVFNKICKKEGIDFNRAKVMDIGCGSGFYTKLLYDSGVKKYLGLDITDVLFPEFEKQFPQFKFIKKDITKDRIEEKFDLIIMIDVIEHIVDEDKLLFSIENVKNCLSKDGIFILAPLLEKGSQRLFYVRYWSFDEIKPKFTGYVFKKIPFSIGDMLVVKHPSNH